VQAVVVADREQREHRFECDAVGLGWHLRAEAQLADLARCEFDFDAASRQWLPRIDATAAAAARRLPRRRRRAHPRRRRCRGAGRLAALAALVDLGHRAARRCMPPKPPALRATLGRMDRFRRGLAQAFPGRMRRRRRARRDDRLSLRSGQPRASCAAR
jgi:hypothetical protein